MADVWRLWDEFDRVDIEVSPTRVAPDERRRSMRELDALLRRSDVHEPGVWVTVLAIASHIRGARLRADVGDSVAWAAIRRELLQAASSGTLSVRRTVQRLAAFTGDLGDDSALGPSSAAGEVEPELAWIGLRLLDQNGAFVPRRPYRVVTPDGETIDGQLDANGCAVLKALKASGACRVSCPFVAPHGSLTHTVKPGEHISGIAQAYGFEDYTTVWNHANNVDLQKQRPDPHVLQPGDEVYVPEAKAQPAPKPTGAPHTFTIKRTALKIRIRLLNLAAKPMTSAAVSVDGTSVTTDGDGLAEATVDKTERDVTFEAPDAIFKLAIGALNPADDSSDAGYKARLFNLGFLWDPAVDDTADEMRIALQNFQAEYSLAVTGGLDDATKAKLNGIHGS
jgi:hypothetical protein